VRLVGGLGAAQGGGKRGERRMGTTCMPIIRKRGGKIVQRSCLYDASFHHLRHRQEGQVRFCLIGGKGKGRTPGLLSTVHICSKIYMKGRSDG